MANIQLLFIVGVTLGRAERGFHARVVICRFTRMFNDLCNEKKQADSFFYHASINGRKIERRKLFTVKSASMNDKSFITTLQSSIFRKIMLFKSAQALYPLLIKAHV